jgi:hypothetical protein
MHTLKGQLMTKSIRTPVRENAKEIAIHLTPEHPDYDYLRELFRYLRKELSVSVPKKENIIKKSYLKKISKNFMIHLKMIIIVKIKLCFKHYSIQG